MEPMIDKEIMGWIRQAESVWMPEPSDVKSFDIGKKIQLLIEDIITTQCLGSALGSVASDSDKYEVLGTVEEGNSVCQHFSVLLELNNVIYLITRLPILGPRLVPQATDKSGVIKS